MKITLIAAVAKNNVIGLLGATPWHIPSDLKFFRQYTIGKVLIAGRKTAAAMGPLSDRTMIVVSKTANLHHRRGDRLLVQTCTTLNEAFGVAETIGELTHRKDRDAFELIVVGGAEIYRQLMPVAHRLVITHVDLEPEGDAHFPEIDPLAWHEATPTLGVNEEARTSKIPYRVAFYQRTNAVGRLGGE